MKDLISKMLVVESEMRISISDIKTHSFFKDIDWDQAERRKLDPPFIPELDDIYSLEYFKEDNKIEMYHNPLYKFDVKAGIASNKVEERKFNAFGASNQNSKILKMLEDF